MYCGDETGGIVVDFGSATAKFGIAGEDVPRVVFPSTVALAPEDAADGVGSFSSSSPSSASSSTAAATRRRRYFVGSGAIHARRAGKELVAPLQDGLVDDWDALEAVWSHGCLDLHVNPAERPVLVLDPPLAVDPQRERLAELLFETHAVPALFLAKSSATAAFSAGLSAATVVDLGAAHTRVSPVYDGYQLHRGVQQSPLGGHALSDLAAALLEARTREGLLPSFAIRRGTGSDGAAPSSSSSSSSSSLATRVLAGGRSVGDVAGITRSYFAFHRREVGRDAKECIAYVCPYSFNAATASSSNPVLAEPLLRDVDPTEYALPDGSVLRVQVERAQLGELLFDPAQIPLVPTALPPALPLADAALGDTTSAAAAASSSSASSSSAASSSALPAEYLPPSTRVRPARVTSTTGAASVTLAAPAALHRLVHSALQAVDPEIRGDLAHHVLLVGGGSLIEGLPERLQSELNGLIPASFKPRVVTGSRTERRFGPWIGGSILASLGTFQQVWVSKAEYEEEGAGLIERRCL